MTSLLFGFARVQNGEDLPGELRGQVKGGGAARSVVRTRTLDQTSQPAKMPRTSRTPPKKDRRRNYARIYSRISKGSFSMPDTPDERPWGVKGATKVIARVKAGSRLPLGHNRPQWQ